MTENETISTHRSRAPEETQAVARELAGHLHPGAVLALHGELGAGKTCFVQGLARGLGIEGVVNSPTYTLIHEYQGTIPLFHIDLYRIASEQEAYDLGIEEYLASQGITAIEWPERARSALPSSTIHIRLEHGSDEQERIIRIARGHGGTA